MNANVLIKFLGAYVASDGAAGVDCLVYQNHAPIFRYFAGIRDPDENSPMKGNELYTVFSMTKMSYVRRHSGFMSRGPWAGCPGGKVFAGIWPGDTGGGEAPQKSPSPCGTFSPWAQV